MYVSDSVQRAVSGTERVLLQLTHVTVTELDWTDTLRMGREAAVAAWRTNSE